MHPKILRLTWLVLTLLSVWSGTAHAGGEELSVRSGIEMQIAKFWKLRDFAALEAQFQNYLVSRARTPSGIWRLSVANGGLDEAIVSEATGGSSWDAELATARRWASSSPNSPIAQMAPARVLLEHAWQIRGDKPAWMVGKEKMVDFLRLARLADTGLRSVKSIAARDPTWYELAISLDLYLGKPILESERLFMESVSKEPDYFQTYFVMSRRYDPHMGGSPESLEKFVVRATSQLVGEAKDAIYVRTYWWAFDLQYFDDVNDSKMDCERMMRGARIVAHDYPDRWNTNNLARLAGTCGDRESARSLLNLVPGPPLLAAWGGQADAEQRYARFKAWLDKK